MSAYDYIYIPILARPNPISSGPAQRESGRERERVVEEQLRRAALEGNTESLLQIHRQNPQLLDRATVMGCFDEPPLHAAALLGHLDLANQILTLKPDLAESLDSSRSSPLHLASAKGNVGIVRALVLARPGMCLVSDRDGLNPVHVAARKGKVGVLRFLVRANLEAARARADQGGTVLHLCVKQCEMEGLKVLMEEIGDLEFVMHALFCIWQLPINNSRL